VQTLLRHTDFKSMLQHYAHSGSEDRMAAAGAMLGAILRNAVSKKQTENGLEEIPCIMLSHW
jgi:hypothetical protein